MCGRANHDSHHEVGEGATSAQVWGADCTLSEGSLETEVDSVGHFRGSVSYVHMHRKSTYTVAQESLLCRYSDQNLNTHYLTKLFESAPMCAHPGEACETSRATV